MDSKIPVWQRPEHILVPQVRLNQAKANPLPHQAIPTLGLDRPMKTPQIINIQADFAQIVFSKTLLPVDNKLKKSCKSMQTFLKKRPVNLS